MNVSETLSTLHYANRARNIRNKPVKNTDSVKEELRCLRQMAHFLKVPRREINRSIDSTDIDVHVHPPA